MNFNGNFNKLGDIDLRELQEIASSLTEDDWDSDNWRQKQFRAHKYTQTISLIFDKDFRHSMPTKHPMFEKFEKALQPVVQLLSSSYKSQEQQNLIKKYGDGYLIRTNLVRLLPGGDIPFHLDKNFSLSHAHRVHLPIFTNDKVLFTVDTETINIKEGELMEINNKHFHCVSNDGDNVRTHIILDYVIPGEMCCCGKRSHPHTQCSPHNCYNFDNSPNVCTCLVDAI